MKAAAVSTADSARLAYIGRQPGKVKPDRDSDDWHTPARYVEAARRVLGRIDVDPFSSATANLTVKAGRFLTIEDNALHQRHWMSGPATAWMNPPYGRGLIDTAVTRFLAELPRLSAAIVLVNNATETVWCQALLEKCQAFCLPAHRISFVSPDSKTVSGNTRGQVFFYFGDDPDRFAAVFRVFGMVSTVIARPQKRQADIAFLSCHSSNQGAILAPMKNEPEAKDKDRINLRLPKGVFTAIDKARARRPGSISRNTWITEAIHEKLLSEADLSKLQGGAPDA